jgi:hypothetical protein
MKCARFIFISLFTFVGTARADLNVLNTAHYRIHTDLDRALADDLAKRMESMYAEYSQRLAGFNTAGDQRFEVYLFAHRKDYTQMTGDAFANTGGIFISSRNLLAAFLEDQGRDGLRRTLQHEAFHQFAYTAIGPNLPVWLNEGIAQIFEEGIWTGQHFIIGQVPPRRIRQLKADFTDHRLIRFKEFLAITDAQWQHDLADPLTAGAHYNQAWAMTHFLIFATDENNQPKYRARLITLLKFLHDGQKADDAFRHAFSDNFDGFQERFLEYAHSLEPTREAAAIENQSVLADLLVGLRAQGKRFDDVDTFRKFVSAGGYRLRYTKGAVQWSTAVDPSIYFSDSAGRLMNRDQLYFSIRAGAPLADIVCEPIEHMQFRTIFYDTQSKPDHETIIEFK